MMADDTRPQVLVVEDDPGVSLLEVEVVEDLGAEALAAGSGADVLDRLANHQPTLMLLDYSLPDMTATALLDAIATRGLTCPPFIIATGAGDEYVAVELMRRGAQNYLIKDVDFLKVLPAAIERALADVALKRRLAEAEVRLRLAARVLEGTAEGVMVTDHRHGIVEVNPAFEQMTGYARDEVLGRMPAMLLAEGEEAMDGRIIAALDAGHGWQGELGLRRRDGGRVETWVTTSRVEGEAGQPHVFVSLFSDITARKQAEADLRVSAIAFEAQEGMFITDAQRRIVRVNQAFTQITGYSAEEAMGKTPGLLSSGRHTPSFFAAMGDSLRQSGAWEGEIWNRRKNGEVYPEWLTITAVKDERGEVANYVATLTDITFRKRAEEEIRHLAFYDPLTRLPNRRLMADRLNHALVSAERRGRHGAVLLLDLDNFKTLNDTLGHDAGDQLLVEVARRLEAAVRQGDTVARLGGDEFVVILEDLDGSPVAAMQAEVVAQKVLEQMTRQYLISLPREGEAAEERWHVCSASIGIAMFAGPADAVDELMKRADTAMYQAKSAGRNTLRFFDHTMQAAVAERAVLEHDLRRAIVEEQFEVHYQAQVAANGLLTGAECLLRWRHPQRGMVSPAEFIPVAEDTGLILPIGFRVLLEACRTLAAWAADPALAPLTLAVNMSARQFALSNLVGEVLSILESTGAPPNRLKLELTESLLVTQPDEVVAKMRELRERGVHFSLDDFGTGYSSLSYLKQLPLDQLKIDQSFVRDALNDPNDAVIAQTVIALGKALGLEVIAEGVETDAQRAFLGGAGCNAYQGYLFGRPVARAAFEAAARAWEARR